MKICFDIEIKRGWPPKNGQQKLGVEYCRDAKDYENMGIACLCAVSDTGEAYVFDKSNLSEFQQLVNYADVVIGHNIIGFDNKVAAVDGIIVPTAKCLDTLQVLYNATGKFYGLDAICKRNFNASKTMDGALAPELWQQGQYVKVINYCLADCSLTMKLYHKMLNDGFVVCPYTGGTIKTDLTRLMEAR